MQLIYSTPAARKRTYKHRDHLIDFGFASHHASLGKSFNVFQITSSGVEHRGQFDTLQQCLTYINGR